MRIDIHPLKPESVEELVIELRIADQLEMFALGWERIREGIEFSVSASDECFEARDEGGELLAIFGVSPPGCPWLLGTAALDLHLPRLSLVRLARKWVRAWLDRYGKLVNVVSADNKRAIEWLAVLGFEMGEPVPMEPTKSLFVPFAMVKE